MPSTRRYFLFGALAAPVLAAQKKRTAMPERPSIVLILADDLASWMLGCYGNQEIHTPNIDRLAQTGMRFINHQICTPISSASRATLFTGRTPRQTGILDFLTANPSGNPPQGQAAPPDSFAKEVMISDVLSGAGYDCGYVGEWRMGNDTAPQHAYKYWETGVAQEKGNVAELTTVKANQFLDRQSAGKPFFLTVGYVNPHLPFEGIPAKYQEMYSGVKFETIGYQPMAPNAARGKEMFGDFLGNLRLSAVSTSMLDDQMPVLVEKLRTRGVLDNTLIIFTSDTGMLLGQHGLWGRGLASDPINMYEGSDGDAVDLELAGARAADKYAAGAGELLRSVADAVRTDRRVRAGGPQPVRAQLSSAGVRSQAAEEGAVAQPGVRPIPEYGDGAGYAIQAGSAGRGQRVPASSTTSLSTRMRRRISTTIRNTSTCATGWRAS